MNSRGYNCTVGIDENQLSVGKVSGTEEVAVYFQLLAGDSDEVVVLMPEDVKLLITHLGELITE